VLLLHDPSDHLEAARAGAIPVLQELRAEGTVGAIGVGTDDTAVSARLVAEAGLDCALVAGRLSLLDQSALDELAPACAEHGASLIAGGVYGSGILADPGGTPMYDYEPASGPVRRRVAELERVCEAHGVALATAAIHYPLAHPAVASVLVGARSAEEVEQNAARFGSPVPAALWDELEERGLVRPRR
jgi:D-threo-aldose 1-dehydrogenase